MLYQIAQTIVYLSSLLKLYFHAISHHTLSKKLYFEYIKKHIFIYSNLRTLINFPIDNLYIIILLIVMYLNFLHFDTLIILAGVIG